MARHVISQVGAFALGLSMFLVRLVWRILAVAFLLILLIDLSIPGGFRAAVLPFGENPNSSRDRALVDLYNLNDNAFQRLYHWAVDALQGDLGASTWRNGPVTELVGPRLPVSLELMLVGIFFAVVIGVSLGLLAAVWDTKKRSVLINSLLGFSQSVPIYITPVILIWIFAIKLQWLPAAGWTRISNSVSGNLQTLVLPAVTLTLAELGAIGRVIRADAIIALRSDYIAAAMAKGLGTRRVVLRHALRPASLGLLNVLGVTIGTLLFGSILIELIFGISGLGQLVLRASINRDLYLLLTLSAYIVTVYTTLNALVDWAMTKLDPRIEPRPNQLHMLAERLGRLRRVSR